MDLIKKHYEKILLALVLLGLMGAVVFLLIIIPNERQEMADSKNLVSTPQSPRCKW